MNVFNNVILARNRQLPDDDRMIETCRSIFKSFNPLNAKLTPICHLLALLGAHHILHVSRIRVNINNLSVCIGWCTDQVTLRGHGAKIKITVYLSTLTSKSQWAAELRGHGKKYSSWLRLVQWDKAAVGYFRRQSSPFIKNQSAHDIRYPH